MRNKIPPVFLWKTLKQAFELSNRRTSLNSETAFRNAINFQASNKTSLQLHNGQELKNTENKTLPGSFTQFQPQSHVKTVGIEPLNSFGAKQTFCSKTITEKVPIAPSISEFPPQALLSVEQKPEQQFPGNNFYQLSCELNPLSNERFKSASIEVNSLPLTSNTALCWQNPTSKSSINLSPLTIQNFNGNPVEVPRITIYTRITKYKFYDLYITTWVCLTHIASSTCKMQLLAKQKMLSEQIYESLLIITPL